MEIDIISNIPDVLLNDILSRLPIKDAVRTCILSTNWRHKWARIPNLVFDNRNFGVPDVFNPAVANELVGIINRVLLLHLGPIHKFELSSVVPVPFGSVDQWVHHLSTSPIKELVLEIPFSLYRIPACVFSWQSLTLLHLSKCSLRLPETFQGFANLKSLKLVHVGRTGDVFQELISACPVLERLTLQVLFYMRDLTVDAPKLLFFEFFGHFEAITLPNSISLEEVILGSVYLGNSESLLETLANRPELRRLTIALGFVENVWKSGLPIGDLRDSYANLLRIVFYADFKHLEHVMSVIYFLQCAPILREVEIKLTWSAIEKRNTLLCWESVNENFSFTQLRRIRISGIIGLQYEAKFMNYMLSTSPVLERMTVKADINCVDKSKIMMELLSFRRASPRARVIFLG